MDDFNLSTLTESRNEYCALLLSKITPYVIQGIYSIFEEAYNLCVENDEQEKYLMTFQNFLARVTKWNQEIINNETDRIIKTSGCNYLEDLLTCVHVTQLKLLTSVRVGSKQKKIDIDIPKLNNFIHQIYIQLSRRVYKNVFLFDKNVPSLQQQKNMRELEIIVKECILGVIRDTMPIEAILRSYIDETHEEDIEETIEDVKEEVKEEINELINKSTEAEDIPENNNIDKSDSKSQNVPKIDINTVKEKEENKELEGKMENSIINNKKNTEIENITIENNKEHNSNTLLKTNFNDNDKVVQYNPDDETTLANKDNEKIEIVSKSIDNLEKISDERWKERSLEEDDEEDDEGDENDNFKLKIFEDEDVSLDDLNIHSLDKPKYEKPIELNNELELDDEIIELH